MNTTGIQNYLSNVFHPIYTYDSVLSNFTPRLELSNIDTYSGNNIAVFTAAVGDANNNVYVGSNAGNAYDRLQACSNVTAVGYGAGSAISNVDNSVYMGYYAGTGTSNTTDVIAIGYEVKGGGNSNIFVGSRTGTTGNSNIFIGHSIDISTSVSNQIRIGYANQIPIAADLSRNWVGLGGILSPTNGRSLDVSGNTRIRDASGGTFDVSSGLAWSSGGYASTRGRVTISNNSNVSIGSLQKGIVLVSTSSGSANFDGRMSFVLDTSTPIVSNLSSNKSLTTTVNFTTNNINISNTTGGVLTYDYSITYFPLP